MNFSASCLLAFLLFLVHITIDAITVEARNPGGAIPSSRAQQQQQPRRAKAAPVGTSGSRPRVSQRRQPVYEDEEENEIGFDEDGDDGSADDDLMDGEEEDEVEEDDYVPRRKTARASARGPPLASKVSREPSQRLPKSFASRRPPVVRPAPRYENDDVDNYRHQHRRQPPGRSNNARLSGQPPPRSDLRSPRPGRRVGPNDRRFGSVVPYTRPKQPSFLERSIDVIRSTVPDPNTIREVASNSISAARATTSSISANIYREIKGLTSSELEQVLLKTTRPDDSPVKGKHVERLVGVTYQISPRFDIYDAVLRKLWAKMAEKDWRTKVKALYVLHRFAADGAPEHAPALKAHLRELRRTRDPKRKDKYFNSKQLLAGETKPETMAFRAFMSRYANYVILRAQWFSGMFDEISGEPKVDKKKPPKPITTTALRLEHYDMTATLFKAGLAFQLRDGVVCENTAIAAERVAADLIALTAAVAMALNRVLREEDLLQGDPSLIQKWCELYKKELLPQTRTMVKKIAPKLDAYGLFLPSRMGTSVSQELLERGINLREERENDPPPDQGGNDDDEEEEANSVDDAPEMKHRVKDIKSDDEYGDEKEEDFGAGEMKQRKGSLPTSNTKKQRQMDPEDETTEEDDEEQGTDYEEYEYEDDDDEEEDDEEEE